jgi:hypothetical protein
LWSFSFLDQHAWNHRQVPCSGCASVTWSWNCMYSLWDLLYSLHHFRLIMTLLVCIIFRDFCSSD